MKPGLLASDEPTEFRVLEAARALLGAAAGAAYYYDATDAYIVPRPQIKHLGEVGDVAGWPMVIYLVSPGDLSPQDYTQCATLFPGDFLVTGAVRVGGPELPWSAGYQPVPQAQLRVVADIYRALHLKEVHGAVLRVANRNLDIEIDGWAVVQTQIGFEYSEEDA